jgi:hypothetical protein
MRSGGKRARALFLLGEGLWIPDRAVCSGRVPSSLGGQVCPYARRGRMPVARPLREEDVALRPRAGGPGDLAPPCAVERLGPVESWRQDPGPLSGLRLFKCRQMFLLVVPGLFDHRPDRLEG